MTIGTAAPTEEEMEGIPHYMVAVADPGENWSVACFAEQADGRIQDILRRGKRPVLVGGTGLYLDSILSGRTFAAGHAAVKYAKPCRRSWPRRGIEPLYRQLQQIDPAAAARLHRGDEKRILRVLEVWRETGGDHHRPDQRTPGHPAQIRSQPHRPDLPGAGQTSMRASTAGWTAWSPRASCRRWKPCSKAAC